MASLVYAPHATSALHALRERMAAQVRAYLTRGQQLGVVRADVPVDLLTDIAVAALMAIDAWAPARDSEAATETRTALRMLRRTLEDR